MAKKEGVPGRGQGGRAPARHRLGGALAVPAGVACFFVACLPCRRGALWGAGDCSPCGTCSPSPGGEDHLKRRRRVRRIVPLPRSPLSLAAGTAHRKHLSSVWAANHGFSPGGAGGEAPGEINLYPPPFPTGEGGRGDRGQKSKLTAGAAGDKEGKPPTGHHSGRANKCRAGSGAGMQGAKPLA